MTNSLPPGLTAASIPAHLYRRLFDASNPAHDGAADKWDRHLLGFVLVLLMSIHMVAAFFIAVTGRSGSLAGLLVMQSAIALFLLIWIRNGHAVRRAASVLVGVMALPVAVFVSYGLHLENAWVFAGIAVPVLAAVFVGATSAVLSAILIMVVSMALFPLVIGGQFLLPLDVLDIWATVHGLALAVLLPAILLVSAQQVHALYLQMVRFEETVRQADAARDQAHARFLALAQHTADVFLFVDTEGTVQYVSPSVEQMLGYAPAALLGRPAFEQVHPDDVEALKATFEHAQRRGTPLEGIPFHYRRADGEWAYLEATIQDRLKDPAVRSLVVSVQDLTARKQYEAALNQSRIRAREMSRLKSTLLFNMGHAMQGPLMDLLGVVSTLESRPNASRQHVAVRVKQKVEHLEEIQNLMLDLANQDQGPSDLNLLPLAVGSRVEDLAFAFRPLAQARSLYFELRNEAPDAWAALDHQSLDHVLSTLVVNAIKATEEGLVRIEVEADEQWVSVHICHTGVAPEVNLTPYLPGEVQPSDTKRGLEKGKMSLSLTVARNLVELMAGTLVVSRKEQVNLLTLRFPRIAPPTQFKKLAFAA